MNTRRQHLGPWRLPLLVVLALLLVTPLSSCGNDRGDPGPSPSKSTAGPPACGSPPYGAGNWPPECYRPFDPNSPFNVPLPEDPAYLVAHSQPAATGPLVDPRVGNFGTDPSGAGGESVYYSKPDDPWFVLSCIHDEYGRTDHSCPVDDAKIKIPAGARPEGNLAIVVGQPRTYDAHLVVVDQAGGWEYDLWQVQATSSFGHLAPDGKTVTAGLSSSGGRVDFSWGGRIRLAGDGTSAARPPGDPVDDANAARWAETAGRVRVEELQSNQINHALWLNLPCTADTTSVYPADLSGRARACTSSVTSELGSHPLGTRMWLDLSRQQISDLPVPAWKKTFLLALARYGGFVGDTNTDARSLFYIETEGGNMYSALTDPAAGQPFGDRWYTYATQQGWPVCTASDCMPEIRVGKMYRDPPDDDVDWGGQVWSNLRVLDPCVTPAEGQARCR